MARLKGKRALITGAARGIGFAFAQRYANEGAQVVIADIDISRATASATSIGGSATAIEMDVSNQASIEAGVAQAASSMGGIDILVNNAAVFTADPIVSIKRDDYSKIFDINVAGTLFTMQAVAKLMIEQRRGTCSSLLCNKSCGN